MKFLLNMRTLVMLCFIASTLLFNSCQPDEVVTTPPDPEPDPLPYTDIFDYYTSQAPATQYYIARADTTQIIIGDNGTKLTFTPGGFHDGNGNGINSGEVDIELKEVFSKKDFILEGKPTVSFGDLIESGGALNITASQNGAPISSYGYQVDVPVSSATSNPSDMQVFFGTEDSNGDFTWEYDQGASIFLDTVGYYHMVLNQFDWINCDYFYDQTAPRVNVTATSTISQDDTVSVYPYLVFTDINSVMNLYPNIDGIPQATDVPAGLNAKLIMIGMSTTQFYYGEVDIVTAEETTDVTLFPVTEDELNLELDGL